MIFDTIIWLKGTAVQNFPFCASSFKDYTRITVVKHRMLLVSVLSSRHIVDLDTKPTDYRISSEPHYQCLSISFKPRAIVILNMKSKFGDFCLTPFALKTLGSNHISRASQ